MTFTWWSCVERSQWSEFTPCLHMQPNTATST